MSEQLDHTLLVAEGVSFGLDLVLRALPDYRDQRKEQRKMEEETTSESEDWKRKPTKPLVQDQAIQCQLIPSSPIRKLIIKPGPLPVSLKPPKVKIPLNWTRRKVSKLPLDLTVPQRNQR